MSWLDFLPWWKEKPATIPVTEESIEELKKATTTSRRKMLKTMRADDLLSLTLDNVTTDMVDKADKLRKNQREARVSAESVTSHTLMGIKIDPELLKPPKEDTNA